MAYAEKRGKTWRVRYQTPDGSYKSESGFTTKAAAKRFGEDQEAAIRARTWIDPQAGRITLNQWFEKWLPAQDIAPRTVDDYEIAFRVHIRPTFGDKALGDLMGVEIDTWYKDLLARRSLRTANGARKLLKLLLDDAVADRLLTACPVRPLSRRRGRVTAVAKPPREGVAVELETILALRPRMLPGDWLMVLTGAFTGMRWGELIGVRRSFLMLVPAEGQTPASGYYILDPEVGAVHEDKRGKRFYGPPKGYKGRTIELPPFLAELLLAHTERMPASRDLLFPNRAGIAWARNNWNPIWRRACDGWPERDARQGRSALIAAPPIHEGLHMHDLRHTHKTWLAEDGIEKVARDERLGHEPEGMDGVYLHSTPAMRAQVLRVLQERWERSLKGVDA